MSARRTRTRIAALSATAVGAMLVLTGCLDVKADLEISPEATANGTISLALQKQAASFMGVSSVSDFEAALNQGDIAGSTGFVDGGSCQASESDAAFVYSCTFTDTAFTTAGELWTITKQDDSIVFALVSAGQDTGSGLEADMLAGASLGSITVDVAFPGTIITTTGTGVKQTSDTTATIEGDLTEELSVTITSETGGGMNIAALLVVIVLLAIVALIVVVLIVMIARRRRPDALEGESAFAAPAPGIEDAVAAEAAAEAGMANGAWVMSPPAQIESGSADDSAPMADDAAIEATGESTGDESAEGSPRPDSA